MSNALSPKKHTSSSRCQPKGRPKLKLIYLKHFTIDEGLEFIQPENLISPLVVFGERVKRDHARFAVLRNAELKCFECGRKATHFIIDRHRHDKVFPYSLNLYSDSILMTWDHIVPRSLGGSDHWTNGRIACARCNERRGNLMTIPEMVWSNSQDPLLLFKNEQPKLLKLSELIRNAIVTASANSKPVV